MPYIKYKEISYVLSEKPGISGEIAFEFLTKIIEEKEHLQFEFYGHGKNESINLLKAMYNDTVIYLCEDDEEKFFIRDFDIKDGLIEVLRSLGKYPNLIKITKPKFNQKMKKVDYYWSMEYMDEYFTFFYMEDIINDSKINLIEEGLLGKGLFFERKKEKIIKIKQS